MFNLLDHLSGFIDQQKFGKRYFFYVQCNLYIYEDVETTFMVKQYID